DKNATAEAALIPRDPVALAVLADQEERRAVRRAAGVQVAHITVLQSRSHGAALRGLRKRLGQVRLAARRQRLPDGAHEAASSSAGPPSPAATSHSRTVPTIRPRSQATKESPAEGCRPSRKRCETLPKRAQP